MAEAARISGWRRSKDTAARWLVRAGGMLIIVSILGILAFLVMAVLPLARGAETSLAPTELPVGLRGRLVALDATRSLGFTVAEDGRVSAFRFAADKSLPPKLELEKRLWQPGSGITPRSWSMSPQGSLFAVGTTDGRVLPVRCRTTSTFSEGAASVAPDLEVLPEIVADPGRRPVDALALQETDKGVVVATLVGGTELAVIAQVVTINAMSDERETSEVRRKARAPFPVTTLCVDHEARDLYAGAADGRLCWWSLSRAETPPALEAEPQLSTTGASAVTALTLLLGDRTLVVGTADGRLAAWMQVRQGEGNVFQMRRVREFPALDSRVVAVARSARNKAFAALDGAGTLGLYYGTTGSERARLTTGVTGPVALAPSPKSDGLAVLGTTSLATVTVADPHPEATFAALFTKVWYEGATEPSLTWQSSGGSDDFEIKLSLIPLIVGTLKGTLFSLLLAVPLAVLGAMYVAHFMHPDLKRTVKPVIEIMAALPSVVLGFLAAMWLAPRVERSFCALILAPLVLPCCVLAAGTLGTRLPKAFLARFRPGTETVAFAVVLVLGYGLCLALAPGFESLVFGGDFPGFVQRTFGVVYEQRNAVVIGLAMSFAVVPIVFSIAEEAFTNVPRGLVSGSLALGATRWQTVTRVVLPTASPGIFSAIMVGFGRAVGETMIVLMATGNTAILDLSPFNGFRTLSANIAVEIPEAPQGGTLYRVLFFAGLVLFVFTFVANTVAELVRQRLRVRFAGL